MAAVVGACGSDDAAPPAASFPTEQAKAAIATYKALGHAVYEDAASGAKALKTAVDAFVAAPSAETQQAAKVAWHDARVPYNQNDAFRFVDGPIDHDPDGPEGNLNGWPLDENYIDYTRDAATAGIINLPAEFPTIDKALIEKKNGVGGEKNLSAGFHAVEFLLWGQDDLQVGQGAGKRSFSDYVSAPNADRRGAYLKAASELIAEHLETVEQAWEPGQANYAADLGVKADENGSGDAVKDALSKMIRGMGSLAKAELAGERMTVAFKSRDQEDEHSCFSDETWHDLHGNALGIQNVWLGQYKGASLGPGLNKVYEAIDPALAAQVTGELDTAVSKLKALADNNAAAPFDVVIAEPDGSANRAAMIDTINALRRAADGLSQGASRLGLTIELEKPSEEL